MVANLTHNPVTKTPEKGKANSNETNSIASLRSPATQFFSKENSDNIDLPNSGSKALKSVQLFGENENHQSKPTSSRVLNSSPSFPPIQRKGSTIQSPKTAGSANKTGLPDNVKSGVEQLSGVSLSDVKVHYNSPKPAQLQAHAYAQGTDIHVASGQEKHVPHEAWHVVQQKQGRVQATKQMKGKVPVNDDAELEKEADVMGAKAVQMVAKQNSGVVQQISASNKAVAQLGMFDWMKSMYKGAKRMLGFGGKEKDEKVGVSPTEVDVIPKAKENKHSLISLSKNPERFNKEETKKILDSKTNAKKDSSIIPTGKVEETKKGDFLKNHIAAKSRQQALLSSKKHGQGMAEQLAKGGDGKNENVNNFTKDDVAPEALSKNLMDLVSLSKYDDTSSASVLELANGGSDLSDHNMWRLIVVNSKFMSYIKEGMTVNKIIPDSTVENVLKINQNDAKYGTSIGGSLAHEKNYDQGLTGEEATANFGLDYGGYKAGTLKANGKDEAGGGKHSTYVFDTDADEKGRTLKAVPNVFYMKVAIPAVNLPDVKVPVHGNVQKWAHNKLNEIQRTLDNPSKLLKIANSSGAVDSNEMRESLIQKLAILNLFISRSKVDANMLTTLTADKKKNKEDPLTNMGMTKPSSRLQTEFGTINQEYHTGYFPVPAGSGLWLKDATGVDTLVGEFIANPGNSNTVEWGNLNKELIGKKLTENSNLIAKK